MDKETAAFLMDLGDTEEDALLASRCLTMHTHELVEKISVGCVYTQTPDKGYFVGATVAGVPFSVSCKATGAIALRAAWDMFEVLVQRHANSVEGERIRLAAKDLFGSDDEGGVFV